MVETSPLRIAEYQTEEKGPIFTRPTSVALGATKTPLEAGLLAPNFTARVVGVTERSRGEGKRRGKGNKKRAGKRVGGKEVMKGKAGKGKGKGKGGG